MTWIVLSAMTLSGPAAAVTTTEVVAVVLGTAQDGGLPQANCRCARCERARRRPRHRRLAASLALLDLVERKVFLVDATPDLPEQLDRLAEDPELALEPGRTPLAGVLLTHAHVGHYAGLVHFGREVMASKGLPLHVTDRMSRFLRDNGPWSQLVELGQVELRPLEPGRAVTLTRRLSVTPLRVPHRDEFSDTVGFLVSGPRRSLLWLPDIDKWSKWDRALEDVLDEVDVAYLDGTFHSADELPGRSLEAIPHPLVTETVERLEGLGRPVHADVRFIHLNHSNPLLGPDRKLRRDLERRGFGVADEGERVDL